MPPTSEAANEMKTATKKSPKPALKVSKTFPGLKVIDNPSDEQLRAFAKGEEVTTDFDAPAYATKRASSRSAGATMVLLEKTPLGRLQKQADPAVVAEALGFVHAAMDKHEWMQFDRLVCNNPKAATHARMLIPKEMARVALLWNKTLFPAPKALRDPKKAPDFLTVYFPWYPECLPPGEKGRFPERMIAIAPDTGVTYVCGVDYVGEAKMSFLRLAMFDVKKKGGLGLHAGSKVIRIQDGRKTKDVGFLLFGLSGTGKTTLTLEDHGLRAPEAAVVLQDDIVLLTPDGKAYGTEDNFYVKTEGLTRESQPGLYDSLMDSKCVFENVHVAAGGKVAFLDYRHGTNGRALALRRRVPNTTENVDLARADKLIFITRRDTIVPPVAKLDRFQAAAYFMLGESIETSAGDASKAGQPKHEVGFSPFIIGLEDEEGNALLGILEKNPDIEAYVLNTGSVGKAGDAAGAPAAGVKITKEVSSKILEFIARQGGDAKAWKKDPQWGYHVPVKLPGVKDFAKYEPAQYYKPQTFERLTQELRQERAAWLAKFDKLDPGIAKSLR